MFAFCSTNEIDIKYEPLPPEYLDGPSADSSIPDRAVINDEAQCTESEPATAFEAVIKDEPMELLAIDETLHPIEEINCDAQNVKPELIGPTLLPSEEDPLNDANERAAKSEPAGFEYHDCKPLAFVSLNNFECPRCCRTFTQSHLLQLHALECRDKETVAATEASATDDAVPVSSLLERRLTERGPAPPRPPTADLRQVIGRIAQSRRRRAASPLDFVPAPAHVRSSHGRRRPDVECHALGLRTDVHLSEDARRPHVRERPDSASGRRIREGFPRGDSGADVGSGSGFAGTAVEVGNVAAKLASYNRLELAMKRVRDENFRRRMESIFDSVLQRGASESEARDAAAFECSRRPASFSSHESRSLHFDRRHAAARLSFPCRYCDVEFVTLSARNTHIKTVHEHGSNDTFDSSLQMHKLGNAKHKKATGKSLGNVADSSKYAAANVFEDLIKPPNVMPLPYEGNLTKASTTVSAQTNYTGVETQNTVKSLTSAMVDDSSVSTGGPNTFCNAINDKVSEFEVNLEDHGDPLATPPRTITETSAEIPRKSDGNVKTKPAHNEPSSTGVLDEMCGPRDTIVDLTSDSETNPTVAGNATQSIPGGGGVRTNDPFVIVHCANAKKKPKTLPMKSVDSESSSAVSKLPTANADEASIGKKTRKYVSGAKLLEKAAVVSDATKGAGAAKPRKFPVASNVPPSNLPMKPTRFDFALPSPLPSTSRYVPAAAQFPLLRSGTRPLQKVIYIDIEGNINSMMTEDENPSANPLYICNICDAWFGGSKALMGHKMEKHMPKPTVKCRRCPELFLTEHLASCHARMAHAAEMKLEREKAAAEQRQQLFAKFWSASERRIKREKKEARKRGDKFWGTGHDRQGHYLCLICDLYFATKVILQKHNIDVHKKANFICDLCGKLYFSRMGLTNHLRFCSKPKTMLSCTKCNKKLSTKQGMVAHLARVHTNVREFECDVCKKRFNEIYNLRFHIKTQHNGERKYHTCLKCNKVFTALNSVRLHDISAHQSIDCKLCDATVIGKAELREHIMAEHRKSTGNKFSCTSCAQTFFTRNGRSHHTASEHGLRDPAPPKRAAPGKELIFCDICGKAYVVKSSMARHMSAKHGFVEAAVDGARGKEKAEKAERRKRGTGRERSAGEGFSGTKKLKGTAEVSVAEIGEDSAVKVAVDDAAVMDPGAGNAVVEDTVENGPVSEVSAGRERVTKQPFDEEWFEEMYTPKETRSSRREKKKVSTLVEESNLDFVVHMIDRVCKSKN